MDSVKLNISLQAKRNRNYPELDVGDNVKIMHKKGRKAEVKRNGRAIGERLYKQLNG